MTSQPLTHSRARTTLFWGTLLVSLAEAVLFVLLVLALLAVLAQVGFVAWVLGGLAQL